MPTPLDALQQLVDGKRPPPPIATLIGFTLSAVSPDEAVIELAAGRQHANPMGALHGGFATVELKINFLKPVWTAKLRATGRLVKRGQTLGFVECDITDEQQTLVARASSTCMTLHGEQGHER